MPDYIRAANIYLDRGWSVVPINPEDHKRPKSPSISWTPYQHNHADEEHVQQWWSNGSRYRLGVVTGKVSGGSALDKGLAVLDIDSKILAEKITRAGYLGTYTVRTPKGGLHLYFYEKESSGNPTGKGIVDIRAEGGQVLAPPTPGYKLVNRAPIKTIHNAIELRDKILEKAGMSFAKKDETIDFYPEGGIQEGQRNSKLFEMASKLRGQGLPKDIIFDMLTAFNKSFKPPLDDEEVAQIADSASKYAPNAKKLGDKPTYMDIANEVKNIHSIALLGRQGAGQLAVYKDGVYHLDDGPIKGTVLELLRSRGWAPQKTSGVLQALTDSEETLTIPDTPPIDVINVLNGMVDIKSGRLDEHSPEHLSIVQLPVRYDKKARCPVIDQFLEDVLPPDLIPVFFEVAGWLMVPDIARKTAVLFLGETDTGKSTAIKLLQALLGSDNYSSIPLQDLDKPFQKAELVGRLANFFDDLSNTTVRDTAVFKTITSGGRITVEKKYGQPYQVTPFTRLLFAANEPPRTWDTTSAYFNRWLIFNFPNQVIEKDPFLVEKMTTPAELSGFFNKALAGLRKGTFSKSSSAAESNKLFRTSLDPVMMFVEEKCLLDVGVEIEKSRLASSYNRWAQEFRKGTMSSREFNRHLENALLHQSSVIRSARTKGRDYWRGISLK